MANNIIASQAESKLMESINKVVTKKVMHRSKRRSNRLTIADAGATGHSVMMGPPVINMKPASNPVTITLLNGENIMSIHTCNLTNVWLLAHMTEAHIVPGMVHSPLVLIKKYVMVGAA
jgi:hypothetical protein